tara:strand:+ start:427 stop:1587 length:1161 start_codon:yes stop_codon:yes gene_type:complete
VIKHFFKADILYTSAGKPIENGMLAISDDGRIAAVGKDLYTQGKKVEYFSGALCPGFINTHCHLELSHLKDKLTPKTGLDGFIKNLQANRKATKEEIETVIYKAEQEMFEAGIVAVGDICNGTDTFQAKKKSSIYFFNFIELFSNDPEKAENVFENGKAIQASSNLLGIDSAIVPHSPYSVSRELFSLIATGKHTSRLSIHNQETASENELFIKSTGRLAELLKSFGIDPRSYFGTGKNSLPSYLLFLPPTVPLLLVHNTYTSQEDFEFAEENHPNIFWCFCPKANLFIENQLPDFSIFTKKGVKCTLGTDSLASNDSLSIFEEMKVIQANSQNISNDLLIQWATINGAEFLGIEKDYGSLEIGKLANINHLEMRSGKFYNINPIL